MTKTNKLQIKKQAVKEPQIKNKYRLYFFLIILFAFILYGNTIPNDYSLDDNLVVHKNEQVMKGITSIPDILTSHYREADRNEYGYRPIAKITFAIESEFFKQNPHVSHFINVLLYVVLLLLLFKILNNIFPDLPVSLRFVIVLLFASHPIHTEVVASLKNREELLCFIFASASTLLFIRAANEKKQRVITAIFGVLCLAVSILSKQTGMLFCIIIPLILLQFYYKPEYSKAIMNPENKVLFRKYLLLIISSFFLGIVCYYFFPFKKSLHFFFFINIKMRITSIIFYIIIPIILIQYYNRKRLNYRKAKTAEEKKQRWRYIYFALFSAVLLILGYSVYKVPEVVLPTENKILNGFESLLFVDNSLTNRISLGFMGLLYYLKLVIIPHPLSFYYGFNTIPLTGIGDFRVLLSMLIHIFLLATSIYYFNKNKILSFGIMFYLVGLIMFANWFTAIPGIIGERLVFVASFGFCILVGGIMITILNKLIKHGKVKATSLSRIIYLISFVIILVYSFQTIARNGDWKNHYTLYKADIDHLGNSAKANSLYADELMRQVYENISKNKPADKSKVKLALKHYQKTIEVYPAYPSAYNNIGTIYFMFYKDYGSALSCFEKAFEMDSLSGEAVYNLALVYEKTSDTSNALKYYEMTVMRDSANTEIISRWANLLNKKGEFEKAVLLNKKIMLLDTATDLPYINIGNYFIARGDTLNAVKNWETALIKVPDNAALCYNLYMYFSKRNLPEKSQHYKTMYDNIQSSATK